MHKHKLVLTLPLVLALTASTQGQQVTPSPVVSLAQYYAQVANQAAPLYSPHNGDLEQIDYGIPGTACGYEDRCAECSTLWQGACDDPGLGGSLLNNPGFAPPLAGGSCDCGAQFGEMECTDACAGDACAVPCGVWAHYSSVYAELLYLRPRNSDVAYGVPIDGPITAPPANNPIQVGEVGIVDPDYEVGATAGFNLALDPLQSLDARYTTIDFSTSHSITTAPPDVIRSIVSHPSSASVATDFLSGSANLDIDYDTVDLTLRHLFVGGNVFAVNYFLGTRYGQIDQRFGATFVNNEIETVRTDVDFEGIGLRLGLDAERHSCTSRWRYYARGAANFLAGRFRASYFQGSSFDPEIVNTSWEAGRIVPTLDLELGLGWRSAADRLWLSVGYRVDAWFNVVTSEDFIGSVQQNDFLGLSDTISFDGLVSRAEWRF
jgi:hypothetical protein